MESVAESFNLFDPHTITDPYPTYAAMREAGPLHWMEGDGMTLMTSGRTWFITRYEDGMSLLHDEKRFVKNLFNAFDAEQLQQLPPAPLSLQMAMESMVAQDGADHRRLRTLVGKAFTPRMVRQLAPRVEEIAATLLDGMADRDAVDLMESYAYPLPLTVIAAMLGVPAEDQHHFRRWGSRLVSVPTTPEEAQLADQYAAEFRDYLHAQFADRRSTPREDLLTALVQAEEDGDKLRGAELVSMVILLLTAGHDTTVKLIGNGVLTLLQHPEQLATLQREPRLYENAVEEVLRYDTSVPLSTPRWAAEDVTLHGQTIRRGDQIYVLLGGVHREPGQFACPHAFDIERDDAKKHLAFGHGIHYCLGAPVARLETRIALQRLFERFPHMQLAAAPRELAWTFGIPVRGLRTLPILLH